MNHGKNRAAFVLDVGCVGVSSPSSRCSRFTTARTSFGSGELRSRPLHTTSRPGRIAAPEDRRVDRNGHDTSAGLDAMGGVEGFDVHGVNQPSR